MPRRLSGCSPHNSCCDLLLLRLQRLDQHVAARIASVDAMEHMLLPHLPVIAIDAALHQLARVAFALEAVLEHVQDHALVEVRSLAGVPDAKRHAQRALEAYARCRRNLAQCIALVAARLVRLDERRPVAEAHELALVGLAGRLAENGEADHSHLSHASETSAASAHKPSPAITKTTMLSPSASFSLLKFWPLASSSRRAGQVRPCSHLAVQGGQRFRSSMVDSPFMRSAQPCRWAHCLAAPAAPVPSPDRLRPGTRAASNGAAGSRAVRSPPRRP